MIEPLVGGQTQQCEPLSAFIDIGETPQGLSLHYLEWNPDGQGDEIPLVMLHGLAATADTWRLVATRLCTLHQIIAIDLRGHGQTAYSLPGVGTDLSRPQADLSLPLPDLSRPLASFDLATIAEDVVSAMAALGLGKVALVGHGWGARVALVLAARHPALISHLILVDCPLVEPKHWPGMTRERFLREGTSSKVYASRDTFLKFMQREMSEFWAPGVESILLTYVCDSADGKVEECLRPEHQQRIREALWEDRALSYYSKVTCPVLLVPAAAQPQADGQYPERLQTMEEFAAAKGYMASQVARIIPQCSVLWMPQTSHEIQLHRPQVLAKAIADFVREDL